MCTLLAVGISPVYLLNAKHNKSIDTVLVPLLKWVQNIQEVNVYFYIYFCSLHYAMLLIFIVSLNIGCQNCLFDWQVYI